MQDKLFETRNEVLYSNALRVLASRNIPVLDSAVCDEFSGTSHAHLRSYLRRVASDPHDWHEEIARNTCFGFVALCDNVQTVILDVNDLRFDELVASEKLGSS